MKPLLVGGFPDPEENWGYDADTGEYPVPVRLFDVCTCAGGWNRVHIDWVTILATDKSEASYRAYLRSDEWHTRAEFFKLLADYQCEQCGAPDDVEILDAHHKHYDTIGREQPDDILVLCRRCHMAQPGHGEAREQAA